MTVYAVNIIVTAVICALTDYFQKRWTKKFSLFLLLVLWSTIYAFRYRVGTDWGTYYRSYALILPQFSTAALFLATQRDSLFGALELIVHDLSNGSWIVFQYTTAVLTYLPVLLVIERKSNKTFIPCLLYIFTMSFYGGFNGMRQGIACAIAFVAYYFFFLDRKYWMYGVMMLISFHFHSSVLFLIPFHLLSKRNLDSKIVWAVAFLMIVLFFVLDTVWPMFIFFLRLIGQTKMANDYSELGTEGSSLIRACVYIVPVLIGVILHKRRRMNDYIFESETILLLFSSIFMLYSMRFWIFARVSGLMSLSTILYVPKLCDFLTKHSRPVGVAIVLTLYFCFMLLLLLHGEGHYYPYRFIEGNI